jgi:hypothetical protein
MMLLALAGSRTKRMGLRTTPMSGLGQLRRSGRAPITSGLHPINRHFESRPARLKDAKPRHTLGARSK